MVRPSSIALGAILALSTAVAAMFVHGAFATDSGLAKRGKLVAQLGLTDLSLFTEARYTRHPSQADLHSAFQDYPMSFDHFPTGSLISPPRHNFGPDNAVDPAGGQQ